MSAQAQRWMWVAVGFVFGLWALGCARAADRRVVFEINYVDPCFTRCGLASWDLKCDELQEVENRALLAYAANTVWTVPQMCETLKGWDVRVHASYDKRDRKLCRGGWLAKFSDGSELCLGGYTHIATRSIEISEGDLLTSSLVHEMGHVFDIALTGHIGHCEWKARGLRRAIFSITHRVEPFAETLDKSDCDPPAPPPKRDGGS